MIGLFKKRSSPERGIATSCDKYSSDLNLGQSISGKYAEIIHDFLYSKYENVDKLCHCHNISTLYRMQLLKQTVPL